MYIQDKKAGLLWKVFLAIGFVGILLINIVLYSYHIMVGSDAKIINELGLIRGSAQRIVKSEFYGVPRDDRIAFIDDILNSFKSDKLQAGILYVSPAEFMEDMELLTKEWGKLKQDIYDFRDTGDEKRLYESSEKFFEVSDKLLYMSEKSLDSKAGVLYSVRMLTHGFTVFTLILLVANIIGMKRSGEAILKLEEMSMKDKLTGLNNRRACDHELDKFSNMQKVEELCIVSIDLDVLKVVNDTYGHAMGDRLITEFADALKQEILPYGFVSRNGGDEFIAIIENCDDSKLKEITNRLDLNIEKRNVSLKKELNIEVSYSCGYFIFFSGSEHTIYEALNLADRKMYENKLAKKMMRSNITCC